MDKSQFDIVKVDRWDCPKEAGPAILTMPNIPKPLHGQGCQPRTIFRPSVWNAMRKKCYEDAGYKCEICGRDLHDGGYNCHELYSVDYANQTTKFERCICLCAYPCHLGCIHTGRALTMHKKGNPIFCKENLIAWAEHAFTIISEYNKEHEGEEPLRLFSAWLDYVKQPELKDDLERLIKQYNIKFYRVADKWEKRKYWGNWKLVIGNREYPTPYESYEAWEKAMEQNNIRQFGSAKGRGESPFKGGIYDEIDKILKEDNNEHGSDVLS